MSDQDTTIQRLRDDYDELFRQAGVMLIGLTPAQCVWRPRPGSWSVAECFEHLVISAQEYLPYMEDGLAERRAKAGSASAASGAFYRFVTKLILRLEHRGRIGMPAPARFKPSSKDSAARSAQDILSSFVESYEKIKAFLDEIESVDELAIVRVTCPEFKLLRFTLGQCLLLHLLHARRHFQQAENVKQAEGFPQ